jgi:transcriptional regulator with XRE-family HTH domain
VEIIMNLTFDVKKIGLVTSTSNLLTFDVMSNVKFSADIRKEFGRWMQQQREDRGLSQKFIAGKIGITETQMSRIENGKSGTERDTVIAWAQAIGIDENEALRKFKPENSTSDFDEKVRVAFQGAEGLPEEEIDRLLQSVRIFVAGVRAERAAKENNK